jgi:hypothetical protein
MKILVLSYAFSPFKGSEFSVAWNYAFHMSKNHQLDIIIGLTDNHMGEFESLDKIQEKINELSLNINLITVYPNLKAKTLNFLNKKNIMPYSFYLAYKYWHKEAYKKALKLTTENNYDLVHYQNPIGYREPGYLWKLNLPYIWGPIGGLNSFNKNLYPFLRFKGKLDYHIRNLSNLINFNFNQRLKKAILRSNLLLINNSTEQFTFNRYYNKKTKVFSESWINYPFKKSTTTNKKLKLVWVGSLNQRKGLIIFLIALSKFKLKDDIILNIVGDGNFKNHLINFTLKHSLTNVFFLGKISKLQVQDEFLKSDFSIYSSLMDANPSVIWESISNSCPIIALDLDGIKDNLDENSSIKIEVGSTPLITIKNIHKSFENILRNKESFITHFTKNIENSYNLNHWSLKKNIWEGFYEKAIKNYKI